VRPLNIYIIDNIGCHAPNPLTPSLPPFCIAGIASYPTTICNGDGFIIERQYFIYSSNNVTTHEVGHWLDLFHTFEGGCADQDEVADTPPQTQDCTQNACSVSFPDDNIMSYCNHLWNIPVGKFTSGQVARMCASLNFCIRKYIWSEENLIKTGLATGTIVSNDFYHIKKNTIWNPAFFGGNPEITVPDNIIIEPNVTLTIENMTVKFCGPLGSCELPNSYGKIIVKPGGLLEINNTLLTNGCSKRWNGIELWCDKERRSSFLGHTKSIIKNAVIGVKSYGPTEKNAGGFINCYDMNFLDCEIGVDVRNANYLNIIDDGNGIFYGIYLKNCSFDYQKPQDIASEFTQHINLSNLKGTTIVDNCHFNRLLENLNNPIDFGTGIKSESASFVVQNHSTFKNLSYGIFASNTKKLNSFKCIDNTFDDCYWGIYTNNVPASFIARNTVYMGNVPYENTDAQVGFMLDGNSTGFKVQGNYFNQNNYTIENTVGLICRETGEASGQVRKNEYIGLAYGNIANLTNGGLLNTTNGLIYQCNIHKGSSKFDIAVAGDISLYNLDGTIQSLQNGIATVSRQQGIPISQGIAAPLNVYSNPPSTDGNFRSIQDLDYHNLSANPELLSNFSSTISIFTTKFANPNCLKPAASVDCDPPCKNDAQVDDTKSDYNDAKNSYVALKEQFDAKIDNGNTQKLLNEIEVMSNDEAEKETEKLLKISPWLSPSVLLAVINQAEHFTASRVAEILKANPNVLPSAWLYPYLGNLNTVFNETQLKEIEQTNKNADNERIHSAQELSMQLRTMYDISHPVLMDLLNASSSPNYEQFEWWLIAMDSYETDMLLVDMYLEQKVFSKAQNVLNTMVQRPLSSTTLQERQDYSTLKSIEITRQEHDLDEYSNIELEILLDKSYTSTGNARLLARNMLATTGRTFTPEYTLPDEYGTKGTNVQRVFQRNVLDIYPTPTDKSANIRWSMPQSEVTVRFTLMDSFGRIVNEQTLVGTNGEKTLDTSDLQGGVYHFILASEKKVWQVGKLVITKF
jgi:hypothetical protein